MRGADGYRGPAAIDCSAALISRDFDRFPRSAWIAYSTPWTMKSTCGGEHDAPHESGT
jgi:hypothetical protein